MPVPSVKTQLAQSIKRYSPVKRNSACLGASEWTTDYVDCKGRVEVLDPRAQELGMSSQTFRVAGETTSDSQAKTRSGTDGC